MEILVIIAKSAAILSLFYLTYRIVLQKDTFFSANRHYLIGGIIASLTLPFLQFTQISFIDIPVYETTLVSTSFSPMVSEMIPIEPSFIINWWMVALVTYLVGVSVMLFRFGIQLVSLQRLIQKHPKSKHGRYTFIEVNDDIAPFSFFQTIVYNPTVHNATELEMILEHEKVHAMQWHTIDVLLTQITLAIQWANPLAWLYKESLEQNLEFIADSEAARIAASSTAYQRTLVKVSSTALRPALTNNFYHSLIKKRIVMLNKEASSRRNLWKLGIVLPMLALFMYSFHVKEVVEYREVVAPSIDAGGPAFAKADTEEVFTLSEESSDAEINQLENYFAATHPNVLLKVTNRGRSDEGLLTMYDFQLKFEADEKYHTRFTMNDSQSDAKQPSFSIQYEEPSSLRVTDLGENGVSLKISQDNMFVQGDDINTPDVIGTEAEKVATIDPTLDVARIRLQPFNGTTTDATFRAIENEAMRRASNKIEFRDVKRNAANEITELTIWDIIPGKTALTKLATINALEGASLGNFTLNYQFDDKRFSPVLLDFEKLFQSPKAFVINDKTTDAQLRAMEVYFTNEHPEAIIEIYGVRRNAAGDLISYDVRTRFDKQNNWNQVLGVHNATSISQGMQVSAGHDRNGATVDLQELGPKGILLRSTPSRLLIEDESLGKGLIAMNKGFKALSKDLNTMKEQLQQSFRIKITKHTTIEELKAIKASLKKDHDVDFNYSNIDFNANNEITGMSIKYTTANNNSGNYNVRGTNGIVDVYFYMDADGSVGLGNDKSSEETKARMEKRRIEMEERREEMKARMEQRKEELETRGEQRKEELKVRSEERKKEMKERRNEMKKRLQEQKEIIEVREEEIYVQHEKMKERTNQQEEIIEVRKQEVHSNNGNSFFHSSPTEVTGSSLFIVSNNAGIKTNVNDGVTVMKITKDTTDDALKLMQGRLEAVDAYLQYSRLKRNGQGEITGISIKLKKDGNKSSSSFSSNNPIQTIWLGFSKK